MAWLKYSGCWINFVLNPYHWMFDFDFGGIGLGELVADEEDTEYFWVHGLFGPFNFRIVLDNGKQDIHSDSN